MPLLYSPDGNKFADKRFMRRLTKSWFAGYCPGYSLVLWNEKEETAWRKSCGFITRGRSTGCNFDFYAYRRIFRDARERVPDVPVTIRVLHPQGKHSTSLLEQQWPATHAGGEFIETNFPCSLARSLSDRAYAHILRYESPDACGCVREPRGLPPTHAPRGLLRLNIYPSVRGESRRRSKESGLEKGASKSGRVCCRDSISLLDATKKKTPIECPWCSYLSGVRCGPLVTLWVTKL